MRRILCGILGHDWYVYGSRPDWSTVEPVYFIHKGDELKLAGWTVEQGCSRCPAELVQRFTPVGSQYPDDVQVTVRGHSEWK